MLYANDLFNRSQKSLTLPYDGVYRILMYGNWKYRSICLPFSSELLKTI